MKSEQLDIKRRMTKKDYCNSCDRYIDQVEDEKGEFVCEYCGSQDISIPYYCASCSCGVFHLNETEQEDYDKTGEFICSDCINKEMTK
jgi:hypothetical protein